MGKQPTAARRMGLGRVVVAAALATAATVVLFVYLPFTTLDRPRWQTGAAIGSIVTSVAAFLLAYLALLRHDEQLGVQQRESCRRIVAELAASFGPSASPLIKLHIMAAELIEVRDQLAQAEEGAPLTESQERAMSMLIEACSQVDISLDRLIESSSAQDYIGWLTSAQPDAISRHAASMIDRAMAAHNIPDSHELSRRLGGGESVAAQIANLRREVLADTIQLRADPAPRFRHRMLELAAWLGGAGAAFGRVLRGREANDRGTSNTFLIGPLLGTFFTPGHLVNQALLPILIMALWPTKQRVREYLLDIGMYPKTGWDSLDIPLADLELAFGSLMVREARLLLEHPEVLIHTYEEPPTSHDDAGHPKEG